MRKSTKKKRGSEIPETSMKWSRRRIRGRKMKRSTKKEQKIKHIGYQEEESSKGKKRRNKKKNCIGKRGRYQR